MTTAVDHISGDNNTKVPKISLQRFLILNSRRILQYYCYYHTASKFKILNYLKGLKITTTVNPGDMSSKNEPNMASRVTDKSKVFHPDDMYSAQPKLMILIRASVKNTTSRINDVFLYKGQYHFTYKHRTAKRPRKHKSFQRLLLSFVKTRQLAQTLPFRLL